MRNGIDFVVYFSAMQDSQNLKDLNNHWLEVILIASINGLNGFPNAINVILSPDRSPALCDPPDPHFHKILGQQKPDGIDGGPQEHL